MRGSTPSCAARPQADATRDETLPRLGPKAWTPWSPLDIFTGMAAKRTTKRRPGALKARAAALFPILSVEAFRWSAGAAFIYQEVRRALEEARGSHYTKGAKILEEIWTRMRAPVENEIRRVLATGVVALDAPVDPVAEREDYEAERRSRMTDVLRQREAPPPLPRALMEYESACRGLYSEALAQAERAGCSWFRPEFLGQVVKQMTEELLPLVRARPVKRPSNTTPLHRSNLLIGERTTVVDRLLGKEPPPARRDKRSRLLTAEEVRKRVKFPLVLVEDLKVGGQQRAEYERERESRQHLELVKTMVGALRRVGFDVYPGGATIPDVYAMADLIAVDGKEVIFVECLTKASIKKHRAQVKKLALVARVPSFCFVGPLPAQFVSCLPSTAYAVASPTSPRTLAGEWVPAYFRGVGFKQRFEGVVRRGRSLSHIDITVPGLRLPEDASGFLCAAVHLGYMQWQFNQSSDHVPEPEGGFLSLAAQRASTVGGWTVPSVLRMGGVPFARKGKAGSVFRVEREGSSLAMRFGGSAPCFKLRDALELVQGWLDAVGFPLHVRS